MAAVNQDVHAWSRDVREVLQREFPGIPAESIACEAWYESRTKPALRRWAGADGAQVTERVLGLTDARLGARDNDLLGTTCHGMLGVLVRVVEECGGKTGAGVPEESLRRTVLQTFEDMGGTCLQGYTHRVATLVVALLRSKEGEK